MRNKHLKTKALRIFKVRGGILRFKEAREAGISSRVLNELMNSGEIQRITRGIYALSDLPKISEPDLVIISKRIPKGIICLISALYFHELTSQIPHVVDVALPKDTKSPMIDYPPIQFYRFSPKIWSAGIEKYKIGKFTIQCYSKEKTIVDCFRYRKKIGVEIAIEALRDYWSKDNINLDLIYKYAKLGRVEKIIQPYIETTINEQS